MAKVPMQAKAELELTPKRLVVSGSGPLVAVIWISTMMIVAAFLWFEIYFR